MSEVQLPAVVAEDYPSHWIDKYDMELYHADKTAVSSSGLKYALDSHRSYYRMVVQGRKKKETKAMNFGKAAHMAILEPERFSALHRVMPDLGDMRSPTNRAKRDAWQMDLPRDSVVLSQEEFDNLRFMIDSAAEYVDEKTGTRLVLEILKGAQFEVSGYFRHASTGLKCRIRPDILRTDLSVMPDLKTARQADQDWFSKECWERKYHIQLAFYMLGIGAITGRQPQIPSLILIQNTEPFETCVFTPDEGMMDRGFAGVQRALETIKEGVEWGRWPGQQRFGAQDLSLPTWTDWREE